MESLLIPAMVAGATFTIVWLISLKLAPTKESQHKDTLIDDIAKQNEQDRKSTPRVAEVQLLKDNRDENSLIARMPLIGELYDLTEKSGMWDQRGMVFLGSLGLFCVGAWFARKLGFFAIIPGGVLAYLGPRFYLNRKIEKRNEKFLELFPDGIDLIMRSVRSGHPINTAMRMIAENMESPIRDEFKQVTDEVAYGRTLTEALRRMSARLKIPDVDFFVVVLAVQQETGGSLTEVLSNLSSLLRKRKQLRLKIRAMTSEGRATSYILGAIPVVEFCALYFLTPSYLEPLFSTMVGWIIDGIVITLIIASQVVIRAMIDIDI